MANVFKLRKGLDINLKGKATKQTTVLARAEEYALMPDAFVGVSPKVVVQVGDHVKAGEALFVNKNCPDVTFSSPVSGTITAIERGERRKVLCVKVQADSEQEFADYGTANVNSLTGDEIKEKLCKAGLFGYINQLPYAISTESNSTPKGIFVSALRDMPLEGDFEYELEGNEQAFQIGLTALSKIAPVFLGVGIHQSSEALLNAKDVSINIFDGPCPAGNVGVQVSHIAPINKGETVWTVEPTAVIFFGRLFLTGRVDLTRLVAVAGSKVQTPQYVKTLVGTPLKTILENNLSASLHIRIINGNPLTGLVSDLNGFLGAHTSVVSVIPEGDDVDEIFGWILPRVNDFSVSRSYFSWLFPKSREYNLDARLKGGKRNIIMSGEYDKMIPMDIYAEYLIKAIISGDIDKQEQLGIYEVSPEDFALAEFVDSSKQPLQEIVRQGLNILRKENS